RGRASRACAAALRSARPTRSRIGSPSGALCVSADHHARTAQPSIPPARLARLRPAGGQPPRGLVRCALDCYGMARRRRRRKELPPLHEARRDAMLAMVKSEAKDRPGTYRLVAEDGEVLYVGKSKSVRTRLLTHFRSEYPRDKSARMIAEARTVAWDYEPSEFAASLAELRLIKRWRPRYNVMMKRDARHYA